MSSVATLIFGVIAHPISLYVPMDTPPLFS